MLAKFEEDERLEQAELEKRHLKRMEYANEAHKLLIEKRQRIMQEYEQAKKELNAEKQRILEEKRIVEEERQHLLRQHANNLWDHLPKVRESIFFYLYFASYLWQFQNVLERNL